jgi:S-methylmethionine-dependent homocysteine/selenocysteine methylase
MGVMHTAVDLISGCNSIIKNYHNGPLMAYPDSGYFQAPNWQFIDIITPQNLLNFAEIWQKEGVKIFGGCCGLGPEHTGFLSQLK